MRTAFVICSRIDSTRLPKKVKQLINGKMVIEHLIERLQKTKIPIILAVPESQQVHYSFLLKKYENLFLYSGSHSDPMQRMYRAASFFKVENIIRVSHDKVFLDDNLILSALDDFCKGDYEYLYSSHFTDGTGFEIIDFEALKRAAEKYVDVEFIGYAIRSVTDKVLNWEVPHAYRSNLRFLIDYPDDLLLFETIFTELGNDCSLLRAIDYCERNNSIAKINSLPLVTVYTCAHNAEEYIDDAMDSVFKQSIFEKCCEYILVDDCSTDKTFKKMAERKHIYPNIRIIKNQKNIGLAASSNVALKNARGKYIIRLDADDFFYNSLSLHKLVSEIKSQKVDVIYPGFADGAFGIYGDPKEKHHPAGALFDTRALNHLKFTDALRNHDGLDLYMRAREQLKIGYSDAIAFFYTHRPDSMSRTNLKEREDTKNKILSGLF